MSDESTQPLDPLHANSEKSLGNTERPQRVLKRSERKRSGEELAGCKTLNPTKRARRPNGTKEHATPFYVCALHLPAYEMHEGGVGNLDTSPSESRRTGPSNLLSDLPPSSWGGMAVAYLKSSETANGCNLYTVGRVVRRAPLGVPRLAGRVLVSSLTEAGERLFGAFPWKLFLLDADKVDPAVRLQDMPPAHSTGSELDGAEGSPDV